MLNNNDGNNLTLYQHKEEPPTSDMSQQPQKHRLQDNLTLIMRLMQKEYLQSKG